MNKADERNDLFHTTIKLLESRIGSKLSIERQRLQDLSLAQLQKLRRDLGDIHDYAELKRWLNINAPTVSVER